MKSHLGALLVVLLLAGHGIPARGADLAAFLRDNCSTCHESQSLAGGFDISKATQDFAETKNHALWVKIHDRVQRGEMPPMGTKRPDKASTLAFLSEIDHRLLVADQHRLATTGRVRLRRMTRLEFQNTLADLLALPRLDIAGLLPPDGRVSGYDKMASALDLSASHVSAFQEAVEKALDIAIATRGSPPQVFRRRIHPAGLFKFQGNLQQGQFVLLKDKNPDPAYPPRGGFEEIKGYIAARNADDDLPERRRLYEANRVAMSQAAVGLLNPNLAGYEAAMNVAPIHQGVYRLRISLWGFQWNAGKVGHGADQAAVLRAHEEGKQQEGGRLLGLFTAPSLRSAEREVLAWLDARESIVFDPVSLYWMGLRVGQVGGRSAGYIGPGVALDWFEIEGPLNPAWPPESHKRLFGDLPMEKWAGGNGRVAPRRQPVRGIGGYLPNYYVDIPQSERNPPLETVHSSSPVEDARKLLSSFLPRAFRREVSKAEIQPYVGLLEKRIKSGDCFEDAMRRVYVAALTSPEFLFLPGDGPRMGGDLSGDAMFALASRLAYWLWNGPPDEELMTLARDGSLGRPGTIRAQVDRLLADRRSDRFIQDFADQWLQLNRVDETTPDPRLYPEYRFLLHEGMVGETRAFLRELIDRDLPVTALLRPGFAMLNQRLSEHYGVSGVSGVEVRKVPMPRDSERGGVLGQASIHKLTANGTTTSPVKRGVWVMDRLLNDPPPPPPPGISAVDPDTRGTVTIRQQLARHRADSSCAVCHAKIDPAGFALESFDPIGGLRRQYRSNGNGLEPPEKDRSLWKVNYRLGPVVDCGGELPDGRRFDGPREFTNLLVSDPGMLAKAFVAHLSRYATGSEISYSDRAEIRKIVERAGQGKLGLRTLIHELAESRMLFARNS